MFILNFSFFQRFSIDKHRFFAVSTWGKSGFLVLTLSLGVIFDALKIDEILITVSFWKVLGKLADSFNP